MIATTIVAGIAIASFLTTTAQALTITGGLQGGPGGSSTSGIGGTGGPGIGTSGTYAQYLTSVNSSTWGPGWYLQGDGLRIYASSGTGSNLIKGDILVKYLSVGAQASCLGYPLDVEFLGVYDSVGKAAGYIEHFQGGDIHWSPSQHNFIVSCHP